MVIDGKKIAKQILEELKLISKPSKTLTAIIVGEDPASLSFLKQKESAAKEVGVTFKLHKLPEVTKQEDLLSEVTKLANDSTCGGILVQFPLPKHINAHSIVNVIPAEKDVDVLSDQALGMFYSNKSIVLPPAVAVLDTILTTLNFQLFTSSVAVIGLGVLVGRPISLWLQRKCRNLHLLRRGSDMSVIKGSDLIISGTGSPHLFSGDNLKEGVLVIDFGYGKTNGKLAGDFNPMSLVSSNKSSVFYTPTPGGTGPILVASLIKNFYILNTKK